MIRKLLCVLPLILALNSYADFTSCKFMFGTDFDWLEGNQGSEAAKNVDYVTKWIVDVDFNGNGVYSRHVDYCKNNKKTPVYYGYVIAKAAGLGDADVGGALATKGAAWLQNNVSKVVDYYRNFAKNVVSKYGDNTVIWLMEPDYYQYFQNSQQSVQLSYSQAGTYMGQFIDAIKQSNTKALFAADITPWAADQGTMRNYYTSLPLDKITFLFTSGGQSQGNSSTIKKENKMTWSSIYNVTNKPMIADCGYGAGGGSTGHNSAWDDVNNLKSRIGEGVIAVTQKNPNGSWAISNIRSQLSSESVKCFSGTPVIYQTEKCASSVKHSVNFLALGNGFRATLPAGHGYESYSLVDVDGRVLQSGKLSNHTTDFFLNGSAAGMKFVRFNGVNGSATYPVATVK